MGWRYDTYDVIREGCFGSFGAGVWKAHSVPIPPGMRKLYTRILGLEGGPLGSRTTDSIVSIHELRLVSKLLSFHCICTCY